MPAFGARDDSRDSARADIEAAVFAAPPFAQQGIGLEEVIFRLGLLHEPFYDLIGGADPDEVAEIEAQSGLKIPAPWRAFLDRMGGSLGPLRIVDWRTPWDFRPKAVLASLAARSPTDRAALREQGRLVVAHLGPTLEEGYHHDISLLLEVETGWLYTDDSCRDERIYDSVESLLLEWGHRNLDPRFARPAARGFAYFHDAVPPGRVAAIHAFLATAHAAREPVDPDRVVGGLLGVYAFHDSGLLVKTSSLPTPAVGGATLRVEARCARRVDPDRCAATAVLREAQAKGLLKG